MEVEDLFGHAPLQLQLRDKGGYIKAALFPFGELPGLSWEHTRFDLSFEDELLHFS